MIGTRPSPFERFAFLAGTLALPLAGVLALVGPEAPPTKGGGWQVPGPAEFVALVAGLLLVLGTARTVAGAWQTRRWSRATGVIEEARGVGKPYLFLRCRYEVADQTHQLETVRHSFTTQRRFREGAAVSIRYDPAVPSHAQVHPVVSPLAATGLGVGLVVLTLGAFSMA